MKKSVVFIIAGVILVLGVYVARYLDAPVETRIAQVTEYEESVTGDAYLIRDESVYQAGASGTFYAYAQEGARVGKDRLIAAVYNGVVDEQVLQELNNLDKKIAELEEYSKKDTFVADEADSENRLKNLKNQIIEAAADNNPSEVAKIKGSIKSIISGAADDGVQNDVEQLKSQKSAAEAQLGHSKVDIYSDCSGVFSTHIDGLEEVLTADKINDYTTADFDSAAEKIAVQPEKSAALDGEPICKVIDNHVWYVMVKLPADKLADFKKGQDVTLRFDSVPGVEAGASIVHITVDDGAENRVVILECKKYIEGIFSVRQSTVEIISQQYKGFEIPIYAVRVKDGQQGVMVQYGINEIFKPCKVIFTNKDNDTVIIESVTENVRNPLEQYDKIVLGEKADKKADK